MIKFNLFVGPHGIPVYHQRLPKMVKSVALDWAIFTGAADDESVGAPGVYHWFEHVPFRGTKQFPGGYKATSGQFTRHAGDVNASTNFDCTKYSANVHLEDWPRALKLITSLWSEPLLEDAAIEAERQIIFEEIRRADATVNGRVNRLLNGLAWPNHPLGHTVLGSEKSLQSITPAELRQAYQFGYDRSRAVLFVSGNLAVEKVLDQLAACAEIIPDHGLAERRQPAAYGTLPTPKPGAETWVETEFSASVVFMSFPVPAGQGLRELLQWSLLIALATEGGLDSPLYRIVRDERRLAYNTGVDYGCYPDGGSFGFRAETSRENIAAVCAAFRDVLADKHLRSRARFNEVKEALRYGNEMTVINPRGFNRRAINYLRDFNRVLSNEQMVSIVNSITLAETRKALDQLDPDKAHWFIFKGLG